MTLLAKPEKGLKEHLKETLAIANEICKEDTNLKKYALIASAFHDIGKADERFQKYVRNGEKSPPHSLLGLPIVENILATLRIEDPYKSLVILAIASHHTPLHEKLHFNQPLDIDIELRQIDEVKEILRYLLWYLGYNVEVSLEDMDLPRKILEIARKTLIGKYASEKIREYFVKIQGCLMSADYLASGERKIKEAHFPKKIVDEEYTYQIKAKKFRGNVFITLPTGAGKTETALYWAKNNFRGRLFYILPTSTTINAMYKRMRKFFGETVALYHSYADMFLFFEDENFDNLLYYKYFLYPINVTTPDQLMLALMNYKRYTLKNSRFYNSTLVIDEIHSYDPETFFLLKYMLKYLSTNSNICIMSATFPDKFKEDLSFLKGRELIPKNEVKKIYSSKRRTNPIFVPDYLPNYIEEILGEYKKGKSILVVLNTVKRAQQFYQEILEKQPEIDVELFHSRYILKHKWEKEDKIMKSNTNILIATQVVEVSLDIDYDLLYTEATFLDSLVQRAGRVNRKGVKSIKNHNIKIFQPESHHPYNEKFLEIALNFLENMKKIKSELDYLDLTNQFYDKIWDEIKKEEENRYEKIWKELSYLYSIDLVDEKIQKLLKTRSGIINIPAIPHRYFDEINQINDKIERINDQLKREQDNELKQEKLKLIEKKRTYIVNTPIFYKNNIKRIDQDYYVLLDYDSAFGLKDKFDNMT